MVKIGRAPEIEPTPDSEFDLEQKFPEFKNWEMIGFHRQLGSELWNVTLQFIQAALIIVMVAIVTPLTNPYPEVGGFQNIANGLFGIIFTLFDVPTNFGVNQFIAENRVKNPEKMMEYIRFVIWWQMMSGLIQITGLSYFTISVLVYGNYAYLTWLILFTVQKQWPSMLGIFRGCIDGFQHFDISNLIGFLSGTVVGQLMNIALALFGRWWGMMNPGVGEILGMAIFTAIGSYANDIIWFFVSMYFFNRIVKPMGFTIKDAWRFKFGRDVVKRSLSYGIQSSIVPVVGGFTGTTMLIWNTMRITSYASWSGLVGTGTTLSGVMGNFGGYNLQAALAESYPNGKKKLAEFYISYSMRWRMIFIIVFGLSLIAVFPFFDAIIRRISGLEYWVPALVFFYPGIARRFCDPLIWLPDQIFGGTFKIRQMMIARLLEISLQLTMQYLYLFVWGIQNWGIPGIIFLFVFDGWVNWTVKSIGCAIYAHKKIVKIKIYWMSSLFIPLIAASPVFLLSWVWYNYAFWPMLAALGVIPTAAISIMMAFFVMFFVVYFPLLAVLGGFDDSMFFIFKKAVAISGPSKPLLTVLLKEIAGCIKAGRKLRLHGRFGIPYKEAYKEIEELMIMKKNGTFIIGGKALK